MKEVKANEVKRSSIRRFLFPIAFHSVPSIEFNFSEKFVKLDPYIIGIILVSSIFIPILLFFTFVIFVGLGLGLLLLLGLGLAWDLDTNRFQGFDEARAQVRVEGNEERRG